jgi:hypothetical protein
MHCTPRPPGSIHETYAAAIGRRTLRAWIFTPHVSRHELVSPCCNEGVSFGEHALAAAAAVTAQPGGRAGLRGRATEPRHRPGCIKVEPRGARC